MVRENITNITIYPCRPVSPFFEEVKEDSCKSNYASATAELRRRVCTPSASPREPGGAGGARDHLPLQPLYESIADACIGCCELPSVSTARERFHETPSEGFPIGRGFGEWRSAPLSEAAWQEGGYAGWDAGRYGREAWEGRDNGWLPVDIGGLEGNWKGEYVPCSLSPGYVSEVSCLVSRLPDLNTPLRLTTSDSDFCDWVNPWGVQSITSKSPNMAVLVDAKLQIHTFKKLLTEKMFYINESFPADGVG